MQERYRIDLCVVKYLTIKQFKLKIIFMKRNVFLAVALLATTIAPSFAQNNLGQDCGCPPVSSRTSVAMSTLATAGVLNANTTLTCDKIWVLDQKIYVTNGKTLTIQPGTVIKGAAAAQPVDATALIISRGGKIMADGTKDCPIVFTGADDNMDGTYSLTNVGRWGGLVILGTASNNLTIGNYSSSGASGFIGTAIPGVGFIEGFDKANVYNLFGAGAGDASFPAFNDDDNSGIIRYVSVRHAGALIVNGNELNGISLGSVGRGTTFEHVEVLSAADDNIEFFGGTVNLKYVSTLFGDDDMFDYDLGYSGKVQFFFGISADSLTYGGSAPLLTTTDNGFEADGDDKSTATAAGNHSNPVIYNVTLIGNGHIIPRADNTGPAAIHAKEITGGQIYNSIFANFRSGLMLSNKRSTTSAKGDAYDQWTNNSANAYLVANGGIAQYQALKVKNNYFINCGNRGSFSTLTYPISTGSSMVTGTPIVPKALTMVTTADTLQFFQTDNNKAVASVAGIDWKMGFSADKSQMIDPYHAIPSVNLISPATAPNDGFFSTVNYIGAFDANKSESWLSGFAQMQMQTIQGANPTDLNGDGITNVTDFSIFVNMFDKASL